MYFEETCKSYSIGGRQLCTNWQKLTVSEVYCPLTSKTAEKRRTPQLYELVRIVLSNPFPQNLQNIISPKPLELGGWIFERILTPHHVSHITCHMSFVMCHVSHFTCLMSRIKCHMILYMYIIFKWQFGKASRWRVCYQLLVFYNWLNNFWLFWLNGSVTSAEEEDYLLSDLFNKCQLCL